MTDTRRDVAERLRQLLGAALERLPKYEDTFDLTPEPPASEEPTTEPRERLARAFYRAMLFAWDLTGSDEFPDDYKGRLHAEADRRAAALLSRQDGERAADAYIGPATLQAVRDEIKRRGRLTGHPIGLWTDDELHDENRVAVYFGAPPAPEAPSDRPAIGEIVALAEGEEVPETGQLWRHYKGGLYEVVTRAVIEATMEIAVVYRAVAEPHQTFVRSLDNWLEVVDGKPRFRLESSPEPDAGEAEGEGQRLASELIRIAGAIEATVDNHHGHPLHWSDSGDVQEAARMLRRLATCTASEPSEQALKEAWDASAVETSRRLNTSMFVQGDRSHDDAFNRWLATREPDAEPESFRAE